jgi:hypothetical protein
MRTIGATANAEERPIDALQLELDSIRKAANGGVS